MILKKFVILVNVVILKKCRDFEKIRDFENRVILKIPRATGSDHVNNTCPLGYKGQLSREQHMPARVQRSHPWVIT